MLNLTHYKGLVYRGHDPRWSFTPESGEGAMLHGGRFNPKGTKALYTSVEFQGAWLEAQQGFINKPQPLTFCSYKVDCTDLVDLTDQQNLDYLEINAAELSGSWLMPTRSRALPVTQQLAKNLIAKSVAGIIVNSFVPNTAPTNKNVVFWDWSHAKPHRVVVIDSDKRLPKNQRSWE